MSRTDSIRGRTALAVTQCAGMVDLVALPVWVGTLVQAYQFDPQQAGLLVTLFLVGVVVASIAIAPLFQRLRSLTQVSFGKLVSMARIRDSRLSEAAHAAGAWVRR